MEFTAIFTQMGWVPAVLLSVGVVFSIVEVFVPGFGFFGIVGIGSMVAGIIVRIAQGLNVLQSIVLILLVLGFFAIAGMFMVFSAQTNTSISQDYDKTEKELRKLIGKSGRAVSKLNLGGKAKIRGKIYDVVSATSLIPAGAHIKVIEIKDNHIIVRKSIKIQFS